jgi:hypothetical protein
MGKYYWSTIKYGLRIATNSCEFGNVYNLYTLNFVLENATGFINNCGLGNYTCPPIIVD